MSQNDFNIANQGFPATRADINSALQALASNSAGTSEPSTTYAYQFWYDETNELLKMRNSDNDAWITIGTFDQVADTFTPAGVTTDKIEEGNSSVEVVDTGTGYIQITVDGAEAARVTSTGQLLIGRTATSGVADGHRFDASGFTQHVRDGGEALEVVRETSDGNLVVFKKDTTQVGSIGTYAGTTYIGSTDGSDAFIRFQSNAVVPCASTGGARDNAIDIGDPAARFKDLYLSGGVYLGGTGAANYLDDYEEGTWTPAPTVGSASSATGYYTKIGRQVTIVGYVTGWNNTTNNETLIISGLPFTGGVFNMAAGSAMWGGVNVDFAYQTTFFSSSSQLRFHSTTNGSFDPIRHIDLDNSSTEAYFIATYFAA